jgi:hypothetical protein
MVSQLTQHFVLGYFRSSALADSVLFGCSLRWALSLGCPLGRALLSRLSAWAGSSLSVVRLGGLFLSVVRLGGLFSFGCSLRGLFWSLDIDGLWPWTAI